MGHLPQVSALMLTALLLTGCGNGADSERDADASGCRDAVAEVAAAANVDDEADLQPAFDACQDLAEFGSAVQDSPEALEDIGADVNAWVQEKCQESDTLRGSALCESVQ